MSTTCRLMPKLGTVPEEYITPGNIDPNQIDEWTEDEHCLAEVQHEDIVNFLFFSTSCCIFEEMKAFKII